MKDKRIGGNEWLELRTIENSSKGVDGYTYYREVRCKGKIVSVLPFKHLNNGSIEYLLRNEVTPCWGMEPQLSSFTGGVEKDDPREDAVRELYEEAGFTVEDTALIDLGTCRGPKCGDTVYYLYAIDVTGLTAEKAKGDGSELEAAATNVWRLQIEAQDPLVYALSMRLTQFFNGLWMP